MGGMITSETCPELRTAEKIWICVDQTKKTIHYGNDLFFNDSTKMRTYEDDDFIDQLTAAVIEEKLK